MFSLESAREAADQYLQGHDPDDPLVSPVLAELATFPPTLLFASSDEVLLDDTITMVSALAQARAPVTTRIRPGLPHTWPNVAPDPDTARHRHRAVLCCAVLCCAVLCAIIHFVDQLS
ncbi:alpha/beta hydrolase [Frankia sp. R82]|uniref:alpha/beta hydrolase n=1 Tax=Frankia sp. R82 TaxID=2950553 RepID=UPI0020439500|nr:alpha/beta hydrolase fold domain-containing protein [Frankia sp. R82]MCM3883880.1 alpha/beta hydrolase [Frankia sp. R82]